MDPAFAPIAEAFAGKPGVMSGKMMASFGLRLHGKIFAMHVRGKLVVKLPKARVDALVAQRVGKPFEPGPGRVMKEWLSVPPGSGDWLALSREAFAFAGG
jgi:TfoX/Sxy family transcriptional regulator of competence genes